MTQNWQCPSCIHLDREGTGRPTCTAFPQAIPRAILVGEHNHRFPYPGDGGIRFERRSKSADERNTDAD
jgi:hypothetical protein